MQNKGLLLWVDDEIELLKAHIMFLEQKGYDVHTATNGTDALRLCLNHSYDLVFLDEMMPGLSGLETLQMIKDERPEIPLVMVTKSEEEDIMHQAIGAKIADYLIKPVNPSQILLSIKRNIHKKQIETEITTTGYQRQFTEIARQTDQCKNIEDWKKLYKTIVRWELELSATDTQLTELLDAQKQEANKAFARYIKNNYMSWMENVRPIHHNHMRLRNEIKTKTQGNLTHTDEQRPVMSTDIFERFVLPELNQQNKVFLIVIDNCRYDQWKILAQELSADFDIREDIYLSILPTATQYARNAIFSGMMPAEIQQKHPELWVDEEEEEGKNIHEEQLIELQLQRNKRAEKYSYTKINNSSAAQKIIERFETYKQYDLNVMVINFIDIFSHTRTESKMVRELANTESAYRSITLSWFRHSAMAELFKSIAETDFKVIITTDHGSIRTKEPVKIIGDRNTNTNLRYKLGRNLACQSKDVFVVKDPRKAHLPAPNISTSYVFAVEDTFFAYPNNYNHYVSYYKETFQHGGISLEEMMIPISVISPKKRNL